MLLVLLLLLVLALVLPLLLGVVLLARRKTITTYERMPEDRRKTMPQSPAGRGQPEGLRTRLHDDRLQDALPCRSPVCFLDRVLAGSRLRVGGRN